MKIFSKDQKIPWYMTLFILTLFTLGMFADVLFSSQNIILSNYRTDIARQFFYWRDFGFSQLAQGTIPLWNPHIFSGAPFFGGFQSAILYPPNILFLILPVTKAINFSIALHVLLIGFFMYLWTNYRNLHPLACLFSSIILMFSGSYFLHIYAGHLSNLCTVAWIPLVFLCVDRLFDERSLKWFLIGISSFTMFMLAGHPQYVYYTALAIVIYSVLRLIKAKHRCGIVIGLAAVCAGSLLLSAVQILSGLDAAGESVRSAVSHLYTARFSLPPENIITMLVPDFFGDGVNMSYWGRFFLWEMSIFIGVTGLSMAIYGALYGERQKRHFSLTMVIILFVLALGAHTPLARILYHWLPGFDNFRGASKFISLLAVFLVMMAGIGLDDLLRNKYRSFTMPVMLLLAGLTLLGAAFGMFYAMDHANIQSFFQQIINYIARSGESYLPTLVYSDPDFIKAAHHFAMKALLRSALISLLLALLFFAVKYHRLFVYIIAILGVVEIFVFANASKQVFNADTLKNAAMEKFLREHPGDYRILNLVNPNNAMSIGASDIWGYDSVVPLRYDRFLKFTQGMDPNNATQYLVLEKAHRLFNMLRCRYFFIPKKNEFSIIEGKDVMNRIHLIPRWQVISKPDDIFKEMNNPAFDPRQTVILETLPNIEPVQTAGTGECMIEDSSTNYLNIRAKLAHPAILLITDSFSESWQAVAMPASSQKHYTVMPANYTLMAIPLSSGEHHLRLEYKPRAFVVGLWISLSALMIYLILVVIAARKSKFS